MSYADMSTRDLQDELRHRELPTGGKKDALIRRLEVADQERILSLTRDQLREVLRSRGLSVAGNKDELVERLVRAAVAGEAEHTRARVVSSASGSMAERMDPLETGDADDEVFGEVRRAARHLAGVLSDRGVPVDRVLAAFRAYAEGGADDLEATLSVAVEPERTDAQAAIADDDRGLVERLVSAIEQVVDRAGTAMHDASAGVQEVVDEVEEAAEDLQGRAATAEALAATPNEPMQLVRRASQQLEQLSGRRVDGVSGFEPTDDGWRLSLEVVEVTRVPPATEVIGSYDVEVDEDGDLLRYERVRRYIRGQADEDLG